MELNSCWHPCGTIRQPAIHAWITSRDADWSQMVIKPISILTILPWACSAHCTSQDSATSAYLR